MGIHLWENNLHCSLCLKHRNSFFGLLEIANVRQKYSRRRNLSAVSKEACAYLSLLFINTHKLDLHWKLSSLSLKTVCARCSRSSPSASTVITFTCTKRKSNKCLRLTKMDLNWTTHCWLTHLRKAKCDRNDVNGLDGDPCLIYYFQVLGHIGGCYH